jgi:gas vesicle protein
MDTEYQEPIYHNSILSIFAGLLIGGLAGAVTALLLAPQSGKVTRLQIQEKSIELRDQTTDMLEDTMKQVRSRMEKITSGSNKKIKELKHQGKELAIEQLDRVSAVVKASKSAVNSS